MYKMHKIHALWVNGNRKDAVEALCYCEAEEVREFMSYLNTHDRGTAMFLALNRRPDGSKEGDGEAAGSK